MKIKFEILILCLMASFAVALTDTELNAIRDGFEARRDGMLSRQVSSPYPGIESYVWHKQDFALAALYLNTQLPQANQAIIDACNYLKDNPEEYDVDFHWKGNLFYRIYKYFYHDSDYFPGRLTTAAENAIYDIFWNWVKYKSVLADTDYSQYQTWTYWGSENHDAMRKTCAYSAADILKDAPAYQNLLFDDGYTALEHYNGWNSYFKEYLRQRAMKGLLVEIASNGYSKYTLQGWYNFYDFAADNELKNLAGMSLDLWWADWAQDQINGVRGGGKCRIYQGGNVNATDDSAYGMCWFYFNIGIANSKHPGVMCQATSEYRIPLVVMDIALDINGRGVYETYSRRPGLKLMPGPVNPAPETNYLDPIFGGMLRYTYVTPEYVIGTCMLDNRPVDEWVAINSQNRWHGVIFSKHKDARIFPECEGLPLDYAKTYNQQWSVQNKSTLITQKIRTSTHTGDMQVYFSGGSDMTLVEEGGWIFANLSDSFAAVRVAWGGYFWDDANWIRSNDEYAPVIIEVARENEFSSFNAFKAELLAKSITVNNGVLTYEGLKDSGVFTFYTVTTQLPEIDGVVIDLQPAKTFDGPFLNEDYATGVVNIDKDSRKLVLDFGQALSGSCGQWGYFESDINLDCVVDMLDIRIMVEQWLNDKYSENSGSDNYPDLEQRNWPLEGNYNVPVAQAIPVIDGVVSPQEWTDARLVEMVYPSLVTAPNTGTLYSGSVAPDSPADFSLYWYLKWDSENLYMLGVVYDDIIDSQDAPVLCFNPMNNPSATFPGDMFLWVLYTSGDIVPFYTAGPTASILAGTVATGHSVLEAKFPWSDFNIAGYNAAIGDVHGFGLACQDYDAGGVKEHYFIDFGSGVSNIIDTTTWNTITLVDDIPLSDKGVYISDLNGDMKVDLLDYSMIAEQWFDCSSPVVEGCVNILD